MGALAPFCVRDNHFDSFVGAGESPVITAATPAANRCRAVGYYGPAAPAPSAFARLSTGLDEAIVRVITARPGPEPVSEAMAALTPALIRAAARPA